MPTCKGKDWRELCAAASVEPDSEKLVDLVNQILQAFDEREQCASRAGMTATAAVSGGRRISSSRCPVA